MGSAAFALGYANGNGNGRGRSDEEHQQDLTDKNNEIQSLQQQMSQVGPDHASYAGLQNRLNQVVQDRTSLFHPNTPGGLHRLGELVWKHHQAKDAAAAAPTAMGSVTAPGAMGQAGPTVQMPDGPRVAPAKPQTAADVRARAAQELGWAAGTPQNPHAVYRAQLKQAFPTMTDADLDKATQIHAGILPKPTADKPVTYKVTGKPYVSDGKGYQNVIGNDGQIVSREIPVDSANAVASHMTANDHLRHDYAAALGKSESELTMEDDVNMTRLLKQAGAGTTTSSHTTFQNINGAIVPVTVQSTSSKSYGAKPLPTTPPAATSTPELKRRSTAPAAGQETATAASDPSSPAALPQTAGEARAKTPRAPKVNTAGTTHTAGAPTSAPATRTRTGGGNVKVGAPIGYKDTPGATKAFAARDAAQGAYLDVKNAYDHPNSLNDKGVILAWLRGRVNRVTQGEMNAVSALGGARMTVENGEARILDGEMSPRQRKWFLDSAKANLDIQTEVASKYPNANANQAPQAAAPQGDNDMVMATIPGYGTKPIHRSQVAAFKAKYPNGTVQ